MRIVYVARHHQADGNDDEGAIAHALRELGQGVILVDEDNVPRAWPDCDVIMFHKWEGRSDFNRLPPKAVRVCWYFDLVSWPLDPTLSSRSGARVSWMTRNGPDIDLLFATDGDWVRLVPSTPYAPGSAMWMPQGADGRIVGIGTQRRSKTPILMTGISKGGGRERESFVAEMANRWGSNFSHVSRGIYRTQLRDLIAGTAIVVCPDSPVTDHYWSNRVYNAIGFGAFVLHPYCRRLADQFQDGKEIVFYSSRQDLHDKIARYLVRSEDRRAIAEAGLARVLREHTYRHRLEEMLQVISKALADGRKK